MSTNRPEITVAMPAYNAAAYLREAMDSILTQTLEDFELLVVDDGSTDATLAIAKEVANGDSRVRIERLPDNRGRATARNMALGRARGRYLAWMDADDMHYRAVWNCNMPALRRSQICISAARA